MFEIKENGKIRMIRGDSASFSIDIYVGGNTNEPYTLQDGDELLFTVKKRATDSKPAFQKSGTNIVILPEDTSKLGFGEYVYDAQLTMANGSVDTVIPLNVFEILEEVTW